MKLNRLVALILAFVMACVFVPAMADAAEREIVISGEESAMYLVENLLQSDEMGWSDRVGDMELDTFRSTDTQYFVFYANPNPGEAVYHFACIVSDTGELLMLNDYDEMYYTPDPYDENGGHALAEDKANEIGQNYVAYLNTISPEAMKNVSGEFKYVGSWQNPDNGKVFACYYSMTDVWTGRMFVVEIDNDHLRLVNFDLMAGNG